MASAYYEVRHDDITVDNDEELDELSVQGYEEVQIPRLQVWPVNIGIVLIVFGFITVCLGVLELFYLPLIMIDYEIVPILRKSNCYGAGFFAGVFMVLTGSTAVRSSISKRPTSVRKFFNLTIFTLMLYVSSSVLLIYGYGKKWTTSDNYPENSYLYEVHIFVTVVNMLGFLFVVTAFVNYYEVIFCGDFQLCFSWFSFCRRCWCCRHRTVDELDRGHSSECCACGMPCEFSVRQACTRHSNESVASQSFTTNSNESVAHQSIVTDSNETVVCQPITRHTNDSSADYRHICLSCCESAACLSFTRCSKECFEKVRLCCSNYCFYRYGCTL